MNIGFKEDLTHEFKSDLKKISDETIIDAVVAFANTDGGTLYIGVEDDGTITGLNESHKDTIGLAALISNKTIPSLSVRVHIEEYEKSIVVAEIPKTRSIVSTISGKMLRRRLKADGTPENIPMYPYEIINRLSTLSLYDFSSQPVPEATLYDFDIVELQRLKNVIREYNGEKNLLSLSDEELNRALQLTVTIDGIQYPTLTGMLILGKKNRLKELVPTAEVSIQIMAGTDIIVNENFTEPILSSFEKIEEYINARNNSREIEIGLYRVSVFDIDKRAFREALVNAFCHRDYSQLGRIRVHLDDSGLTITNPGGFIEGIDANNLIDAEPHGRNPVLADALKRLGLAERTGRGIDRIFEGSLLFGKIKPDYSRSTDRTVNLFIPKSIPDPAFVEMIQKEQNRIGRPLSVKTLLILNSLKSLRRASADDISEDVYISETYVKAELEALIESGLVEGAGIGKNRQYLLSSKVYKNQDNVLGYVRQTGIEKYRNEELILKVLSEQGYISRKDVSLLLNVSNSQAYRILNKMTKDKKIKLIGQGRNARYMQV